MKVIVNMKKINDSELIYVYGGSINASAIQYATKLLTTIFDLGRILGSSIRRIYDDSLCPVQKID